MPNLYLEHHGIKGMKWGVRRYQNPDGSLTAAGKQRYGVGADGIMSNREQYQKENKKIKASGVAKEFRAYNEAQKQIESDIGAAANEALKLADKNNDDFQKYCKSVEADISFLKNDKKFREEAQQKMKKELVSYDMVDDKELIDLAAYDIASELFYKNISKKTKDLYNNYEKSYNDYYDSVKQYADQIAEKTKNYSVSSLRVQGSNSYDRILESSDAHWIHYLHNHQEMAELEGSYTGASLSDLEKVIIDDFKKN